MSLIDWFAWGIPILKINKKVKPTMTDNYKVYLGSDSGRDYQERENVMGRANFITRKTQRMEV